MSTINSHESNVKEYHYSATELEHNLRNLEAQGVTELVVSDKAITTSKQRLLNVLAVAAKDAPSIHLILPVDINCIDRDICTSCADSFCSLHISVPVQIDNKLFVKKATLLNNMGLVFGFDMSIGGGQDNLKKFRERLDFLLSLYPNHIDFPQLESPVSSYQSTSFFSKQDYATALKIAFACSVFYTAGRAVPWFLAVINPLRMSPSRFLSDFSEWQQCNNCSMQSSFELAEADHTEIEKMQLLFINQKYEEKNLREIASLATDLIKTHGAFSRAASSSLNTELELSWSPEDILSPEAMNLKSFYEQVCMSPCHICVFEGEEGPDYRMLR